MKTLKKTFTAIITAIGLVAGTASASAQTISN